jgi:hypothetical protein
MLCESRRSIDCGVIATGNYTGNGRNVQNGCVAGGMLPFLGESAALCSTCCSCHQITTLDYQKHTLAVSAKPKLHVRQVAYPQLPGELAP